MIILNQEQRLGRKAYFLIVFHKVKVGLIILLIAFILLALNSFAGKFIPSFIPAVIATYIVLGAFILALVACIMSIFAARAEYSRHTFTFEEFGLKLKSGVFKITEVTIPYRQMQDINIERDMLHQMTGTARIVIDSAGHDDEGEKSENDIVLDPIDKEVAEEIRLMLQRKIGVQVIEHESEADREAAIASNAIKTI
ncbi:MAG: PH domain-containing protein [Candidatus Taylorbacteria bacterium]|nr:PH domain-containing protein [Candidatus Taylorbacteria bacterium]